MQHPTTRGAPRVLSLLAIAGLLVGACSSSAATNSPGSSGSTGGKLGGSVTVIGTWSGSEQDAFLAMVKPFEDQTGVKVNYTGTRDLSAVLTTGVASGVLPDLAGLPDPGSMQQYVQAGKLQPLDSVLDISTYKNETAPALTALGTVNGKTYGVFIKSAVKGLIWYNPKIHDFSSSPPATWSDLQNAISQYGSLAQAPWCLGVESGAASGWPATDWLEDLVLREAGPDVYNNWAAGKVQWTDPAIKQAWQDFGKVVAQSYGGANTILTTNFANAGDPLFASGKPGCLFLHQASFITGLGAFKSLKAGTDYNFFPFPDINSQYSGAVEGAGDLFGMFHNTPQAAALIKYLVTAPAQDIWVKIGGALSANKNATDYPDDISKRSAQMLVNAKSFVFDASDLMPPAMQSAFYAGLLKYIKDPSTLDSVLNDLNTTQKDAYASGG